MHPFAILLTYLLTMNSDNLKANRKLQNVVLEQLITYNYSYSLLQSVRNIQFANSAFRRARILQKDKKRLQRR